MSPSANSDNENSKHHLQDKGRPSPFCPTEIKAVKDVKALKEALLMFQKLKETETTLPNPSAMSKFCPSPLLLSSMQRLLEIEQAKKLKCKKKLDCSKVKVVSCTDDSTKRVGEYTPQMIIQKRNSTGGRARFSNNYSSAVTPCSNVTATITPRVHSTRRRRKAIGIKPQQISVWNKSTNYKNRQVTPKEEKDGGAGGKQCDNELSCSPGLGISLDVSSPLCDQKMSQDSQDDFAFHSQSSLPMKDAV